MSSKRAKRRSECRRKRAYPTWAEAMTAVRGTHRKNLRAETLGPQGDPLHVYLCPHCGSYHIGHRHDAP